MSCTVPPLFRFVGNLLPVYRADLGNFKGKIHILTIFVTDFSDYIEVIDFKFGI